MWSRPVRRPHLHIVNLKRNTASTLDLLQKETRRGSYAAQRGGASMSRVAQSPANVKIGNQKSSRPADVAFKTGFGRTGFANYVARAKQENRILYVYKNSQQNQNGQGFQLPNVILSADYTNKLAQFKQLVNQ